MGKGVLDLLEGIVTLDFGKAEQGLKGIFNLAPLFKEGWGDLKKAGSEMANAVVNGYNNTISNAKLEHIKPASVYSGATTSDPTNTKKGTTPAANSSTTKTRFATYHTNIT